MIKTSIIIPTRNGAKWINFTINSLLKQNIEPSYYEILIVDNDSTDDTKKIIETFILNNPAYNMRYIFEPEPGSLSARHRGMMEAKGEILIFVDDDVITEKGWLAAIMESFEDEDTHLVGGPNIPIFEVSPPEWINKYFQIGKDKFICGSLSLLYLGENKIEIDPLRVWSLNWSIRKKTFIDCGGFHPCVIPKHLQQFQGDGETGLSLILKEKGFKAVYSPKVKVFHRIPKERLTVTFFEGRFFYQGVCDSYTQIRQNQGVNNLILPDYLDDKKISSSLSSYDQYKEIINWRIRNAYVDGFIFHQKAVKKSEILLKWVLRENYFNYKLPVM